MYSWQYTADIGSTVLAFVILIKYPSKYSSVLVILLRSEDNIEKLGVIDNSLTFFSVVHNCLYNSDDEEIMLGIGVTNNKF